jgi:hypothetical protein
MAEEDLFVPKYYSYTRHSLYYRWRDRYRCSMRSFHQEAVHARSCSAILLKLIRGRHRNLGSSCAFLAGGLPGDIHHMSFANYLALFRCWPVIAGHGRVLRESNPHLYAGVFSVKSSSQGIGLSPNQQRMTFPPKRLNKLTGKCRGLVFVGCIINLLQIGGIKRGADICFCLPLLA